MDIVEELRKDPESGARRLEAEYKAGLLTLASRFCADSSDAEELVNRTFAAVVRGIDDYLEQSAFFGWMCQILKNIHANDIRPMSRRNEILVGSMPDVEDEGAGESIFSHLDHALLRDAIETLPQEMKEVIVMHYLLEEPVARVAKFVGEPVSTVKWRLHVARKALAAKLGVVAEKARGRVKAAANTAAGKAILVVFALCALTAAGAAIARVGWSEQPRRAIESETRLKAASPSAAAPEQQAATQNRTGEAGGTGGTGETSAPSASFVPSFASVLPGLSIFESFSSTTQPPTEEQTMNTATLRTFAASAVFAAAAACAADTYEDMKRAAVNRERLVIWDDDGCDMVYYPYKRADLAEQPASVRNFELVFLEATENTRADVIGYSGTMGFGYFTALRTGGYVNTNRFADANQPWRNAVNEFAAMGKDAMDLATDFARRNGKEIFLSLRFNDNHDNGYPEIMLSPFKIENPEVMVGHGHAVKCCGKNAADFAQEKVRAFVRKYVRGYMENYDLDGIEFDFFRHPELFRTVALGGHATAEELDLMTQLMKDFRAMAEEIGRKRGRPFVLCARVPDSFDYCRAIGIDLDAWLRAGALDFLVVGGYFQLEPWRTTAEKVHGYGVKCYASLDETRIDQMVRREKGKMLPGRNDAACWIARIAAAMASGMDGVNLFNIEYFNHEVQREIMRHDIRDLDGINKTYFGTYVGGGGYMPESFLVGGRGFWKTTGVNPAFPVKLAEGADHEFEFVFGDDLAAARGKGLVPQIEVLVLTDLAGDRLPMVKIRGTALADGAQKDGIATFVADDATFVKGANPVEIVAPEAMTLHDFSVEVKFHK